jgi:hypothetical protein
MVRSEFTEDQQIVDRLFFEGLTAPLEQKLLRQWVESDLKKMMFAISKHLEAVRLQDGEKQKEAFEHYLLILEASAGLDAVLPIRLSLKTPDDFADFLEHTPAAVKKGISRGLLSSEGFKNFDMRDRFAAATLGQLKGCNYDKKWVCPLGTAVTFSNKVTYLLGKRQPGLQLFFKQAKKEEDRARRTEIRNSSLWAKIEIMFIAKPLAYHAPSDVYFHPKFTYVGLKVPDDVSKQWTDEFGGKDPHIVSKSNLLDYLPRGKAGDSLREDLLNLEGTYDRTSHDFLNEESDESETHRKELEIVQAYVQSLKTSVRPETSTGTRARGSTRPNTSTNTPASGSSSSDRRRGRRIVDDDVAMDEDT